MKYDEEVYEALARNYLPKEALKLADEIEKGGNDGFYQDEMVSILRKLVAELDKTRIDAIKQATVEPCGWFGYYEGKVCTFIFKREDVDEFLKNTDPCGQVRPVYNAPQTKPLSDEEIIEIFADTRFDASERINFARAIEERHGIK